MSNKKDIEELKEAIDGDKIEEEMTLGEMLNAFNEVMIDPTIVPLYNDYLNGGKENKRTFPNGSVRDTLGDKPMLELIPYDLFYKRLGKVYTEGGKHYGFNNYRKGQPISSTIGSLQRHLAQYMMGDTTEDHIARVCFNALSILNADEYFKDDPLVNDIGDWFKDGKPTGKGNYEDKQN